MERFGFHRDRNGARNSLECFTERDCDVVDDRRVYHVRRLNEKKICLQVHILQEFRYSMNMKK